MSHSVTGAAKVSEFKKSAKGVYTRDISFPYFVPSGVPGVVTRLDTPPTIETQVYDAAAMPTAFGTLVVVDPTNNVRAITGSDSSYSSLTMGFLVRPYPTQQNSTTGSVGSGSPNSLALANVMKRGYMIVTLQNSTAATKGGQVYVRYTTSGQLVLGGVEAGSSGNLTITGAYFTGPADSSGYVEIAYNI